MAAKMEGRPTAWEVRDTSLPVKPHIAGTPDSRFLQPVVPEGPLKLGLSQGHVGALPSDSCRHLPSDGLTPQEVQQRAEVTVCGHDIIHNVVRVADSRDEPELVYDLSHSEGPPRRSSASPAHRLQLAAIQTDASCRVVKRGIDHKAASSQYPLLARAYGKPRRNRPGHA